jgi:formaldehyde-activating enzyme involved in methanogenesis
MDNALNNDTLYRYLYNSMARKYDDYLEEFPSREGIMRFKGEALQI